MIRLRKEYRVGELVVYRVTKWSRRPGPRAKHIVPARSGDDYRYTVDKFWYVSALIGEGRLLVRTRRGKTRIIDADSPNLRRVRWWDRLIHRRRLSGLEPAKPHAGTVD